jgi:hypothetical protein
LVYWGCVIGNGGVVARSCFGQVVGSFVAFQSSMPFNPVEGYRGVRGLSSVSEGETGE